MSLGSPATLALLGLFSTLLLIIGLQLTRRLAGNTPAMRAWNHGALWWAAGFALLGLRPQLPDIAALVLGNTFSIVGLAMIALPYSSTPWSA